MRPKCLPLQQIPVARFWRRLWKILNTWRKIWKILWWTTPLPICPKLSSKWLGRHLPLHRQEWRKSITSMSLRWLLNAILPKYWCILFWQIELFIIFIYFSLGPRLIDAVSFHMYSQVITSSKWLVAKLTFEWFLSRMLSNMTIQFIASCKRPGTKVARERSLPCVNSNMSLQVWAFYVSLVAPWKKKENNGDFTAKELWRMCRVNVYLESCKCISSECCLMVSLLIFYAVAQCLIVAVVWIRWLQRISRPADNYQRIWSFPRWGFLHVSSNFVAAAVE